jgi:predicted nucleic acid-binding protein
MDITIDTSALLAVLVNESHRTQIINCTKNCDLQAPTIIDAEVGKALSLMFKRGRLSISDAYKIVEQFKQVPIRRTEIRLREALNIAEKFNLYAYDCYFLDSAYQHRTPLLSLDRQMLEIAQKLKIETIEVK